MRQQRRRAEWAALLSALLPGLGQWWAGRKRRGMLLAVPAVAGLLVVLWVAMSVRGNGASGLLEILVQPRWLWLLLAVNALLAVERLVAVADAWWPLRRPTDRSAGTWGMRAAAAVVAVAMVAPHAVVHVYASEALDLIDTVFAADEIPPLAAREEALLAEGFTEDDLGPVITTTTAPPSTTTTATPTSEATSTTRTTISPTPSIPEIPGLDPIPEYDNPLGTRYTVLLAGGDFGPGRHDLRTDVMIVASLDLLAGKASLIGVSRELVGAPLPPAWADSQTMRNVQRWHEDQAYAKIVAEAEEAEEEPPEQEREPYCYCNADRINYLHVLTANWVRTFPDAPDPGMEALRQTLELLLGIPIDAYVLVDFAGFVDLVDAIGGVWVTSTESMDVGFSPAKEGEDPVTVSVDPGRHLLDGREALAYVRNRTGSSDAERMRRQRCMIRELAAAADTGTLLRNFPDIARAIRNSTTTTMPLELLPAIVDALGSLGEEDIATMYVGGGRFAKGTNWLGIPIVNAPVVRSAVVEFLSDVSAGTTLGAAEDECG